MTTFSTLLYDKIPDGIAWITLARPERGNALTPPMQRVFRAIWEEVRESREIRVAIVTAAGERHFCTGFDVGEAEAEDAGEVFANRPLADAVFWSPHQNRVWKPVICAVNGLCAGGGLHFVVDADVVLASRNAAFMDAHVNVGMVGALENVGLARRLPLGTALRMTLQGRHYRLPAERAHQLGLVDELVAQPADLVPLAEQMARQMMEGSPQALALSGPGWKVERTWRDLDGVLTGTLDARLEKTTFGPEEFENLKEFWSALAEKR